MKSIRILVLVMLSAMMIVPSCVPGGGGSSDSKNETGVLKGKISISGAFALYPLTVMWAEEFNKLHPKVRVDISAGGAGKGMTDALSKMVDLGMFSRSISQAEKDLGCWWVAVAKDAVLPTIHSENPALKDLLRTGITREQFQEIFLGQGGSKWHSLSTVSTCEKINVYTRSDACGAAQMWAEYLGSDQESLQGIGVFGDPGMADAVKKDPCGMGYNNLIYIFDMGTRKPYDGLEVIPIDLNGNGNIEPDEDCYTSLDDVMKAIAEDRYPSPPARELYFVAKGKPENRAVIEFIRWILTEGQQYVHHAGYVNLNEEKVSQEIEKLSR